MPKMVLSEQPVEQTMVNFNINTFPSRSTILFVKNFLIKKLPRELVDLVLDHAEYWPHTTTISPKLGLVRTPVKWRDTSSDILSPSWPSAESQAMKEVLGFTLYSPPLAVVDDSSSSGGLTPAAMLKKGLRRLVLKDSMMLMMMPPRSRHPARMIVFEAASQRYDIQPGSGKFGDVGIIRSADDQQQQQQLLERDDDINHHSHPVTASSSSSTVRRNSSSVFSSFQRAAKPSQQPTNKSARATAAERKKTTMKTKQLVAQRECWFSSPAGAKAEGKYVVVWRYDDDDGTLTDGGLKDDGDGDGDATIVPTTTTTAAFIRRLEIGDRIGLWAPVVRGNCVYKIDEVRMHVFWAV